MMRFSYSKVSCYEQCPKKYKFRYIDNLQGPKHPSAERGTLMHLELETMLGKKTVPDWMVQHVPHLEPYLKGAKREQKLELLQPDWTMVAVLDLMQKKGKVAQIIDYKSGGIYEEHKDQLELYACIAVVTFKLDYATGRAYYLDKKPGTWGDTISVDKGGAIVVLSFWADRIRRLMRDKVNPARPGRHCQWCEFSKYKGGPCPLG